jgi:dipeptidyl aminopeptidase/acylaminoacyl peptidase
MVLRFWIRLILPLVLSIGLATAQSPAPTTFQSENKSVTIERFDPKAAGSHPAVIVVHGSGGAQGNWRKSGLLEALTDAGYIVFVPHYFEGSGGNWSRSANADQLIAYIRTLNDAARFVALQPGVQKDGIGLIGISLGAYAGLALTEEEISHPPPQPSPAVKAVVELYGNMPEFAADRMTTMAPVLILHGQDDKLIPVSNALELEKLLQKKSVPYEMKIYPHQGHGFDGDALADANRRIVAFFKAHLP